MMKEIQQKASTLSKIHLLYGMGSFFRDECFNDIDLVAIVDCSKGELLNEATAIRTAFYNVGQLFGVHIDLTILTPSEFSDAPLRDMETLFKLYGR